MGQKKNLAETDKILLTFQFMKNEKYQDFRVSVIYLVTLGVLTDHCEDSFPHHSDGLSFKAHITLKKSLT